MMSPPPTQIISAPIAPTITVDSADTPPIPIIVVATFRNRALTPLVKT